MANLFLTLKDKEMVTIALALPYVNGPLHLGHLLGFTRSEIYARFLRLVGRKCLYVCASDMHGTPIMINAKKKGLTPDEFVQQNHESHLRDLAKFSFAFDSYHYTRSEENRVLAELFFKTLREKGYIYTKQIQQLYDEEAGQFLPDRFIKGECPKCGAADQYGDVCESCGATYEPTDLVNPFSTITKTKPVLKETIHYYFKLSEFSDFLRAWVSDEKSCIQKEVKNWLMRWLDDGLKDWCISRDEPYFGFEIPGSKEETGEQKYFYVWLDAPIGYLSSTEKYCLDHGGGGNWRDYWQGEDTAVFQFLGKDIVYFHYLFWVAMLHAMEVPTPYFHVNGFITVDGKKMSKSRGTFFTAEEFYDLYGGENLRFYFAYKSQRNVQDIDLNLDDFKSVSNTVFMGKLGNFCYRTLSFAARNYPGGFSAIAQGKEEEELQKEFWSVAEKIKAAYYEQNYREAVQGVLKISDLGNIYFQKLEPWRARSDTAEQKEVEQKVAFMANLARNLAILIKPVVPVFSSKVEHCFGVEAVIGESGSGLHWEDLSFEYSGQILMPEKLVEKIELKKRAGEKEKVAVGAGVAKQFPLDARVGKIIEVGDHPSADKLFVFKIDLGEKLGERQIVAGIKEFFKAEDLLGKKTLFLVNLEPAKIRGVKSSGMTLTAEDKEGNLTLLFQEEDVALGSTVKIEGYGHSSEQINFKQFQKVKMRVGEGGVVVWKREGKMLPLLVAGSGIKVDGMAVGAKIV